jgi:hypothetical protein
MDSTSESASTTSEGADEGDTDRGEAMTKATAPATNHIPPHRNGGATNTNSLPSVSAGGEAGLRHTRGDTREAALFAGSQCDPPRGHHGEVALQSSPYF